MTFIHRMTTSFGQLLFFKVSIFALLLLSSSFMFAQRDASLVNLVNDIKEKEIITWRLEVSSLDTEADNVNGSIYQLRMWADGSYEEIEDGQQLEGLWAIDKREDRLAFLCKSANGYDLKGVNPPNFFEVESYTDTELILLWRGEKMDIRKKYKRLEPLIRG